MNSDFDITTVAVKTYHQDTWLWLSGFTFLLLCSAALGFYVYRKSMKKGLRLFSVRVYLIQIAFVALFALPVQYVNYHQFKNEMDRYSKWIEDKDYSSVTGAVSDIVYSYPESIQRFSVGDRHFEMSDNPYLLSYQDILKTGGTLLVSHRDGVILTIKILQD